MSIYKTKIITIKKVAEHTIEISFQRPTNFSFKAGQYIQVSVSKLLYSDNKGKSRVLSIASSPLDEEKISVIFRDTGSGFKKTIQELDDDSVIRIEGPHGFYTLPEKPSLPIVLIAGGVGIVPYLSMLRFFQEKKYTYPITLFYFNRNKESSVYLDELMNLQKNNKNFSLKSKFGAADKKFIKKNVKNIHQCLWHIAGPPGMVNFVKNELLLLGIDSMKIHYEEFSGY